VTVEGHHLRLVLTDEVREGLDQLPLGLVGGGLRADGVDLPSVLGPECGEGTDADDGMIDQLGKLVLGLAGALVARSVGDRLDVPDKKGRTQG